MTDVLIGETSSAWAVAGASICMVLGTPVNALAMAVILKRKALKEHNMSPVLFYQSFFDLTFCVLCLPFIIIRFTAKQDILRVFHNSEKMCEWSAFLFYTNIAVCAWAKSFISINRVLMIQNWNVKKYFSWKRTTLYYGSVLIFAMAMMSIPMSGKVWGHLGYNNRTFTCTIQNETKTKDFLYIFTFIIPTLIMIFGFGFLALRLKKYSDAPNFDKYEKQINKVSLLIFAAFLVLYGPSSLLVPIDPLEDGSNVVWLHVLFWFLAWCGSVVYPFIYIGTSQFYKREFFTFLYETCNIGELPERTQTSHDLVEY